ncbi:MAG: SRPBCC family protein [Gammaproteobacteria bacterium]|nr:SRPBCC family protein [Gammaproteobacteria bacterium]
MNDYGTMLDETTIRFERTLPGPIERVWAYIVESDKRAKWLCAGETELAVDGDVEMRFHHATMVDQSPADDVRPDKYADMSEETIFGGKVTAVEAPHLLSHTWVFEGDESEVTYELTEQGEQVQLVLTHRRLNSEGEKLSVAAGWHTHLLILSEHLHGRKAPLFWKTHTELEDEYEKRL